MEWEAAAATTNLQNCNDGDPMINLPTTTNCSSSSNSAAGNMLYVKVMTDEQLETLRKQIAVYTTICEQLVEMHKTLSSHQDLAAGGRLGNLYCDPLMGVGVGGHKISARQRWTPTPVQLQILEQIFEQGNGTPTKQKIKEITGQLSQHGQISETNVYNWFQNRRARSKRKQLLPSSANNNNNNNTASSAAAVTASGGDLSEVDTEVDSLNDQEDILIKNLKPPSAASGAEMYNHSPHSHISASQFNYLAQSQSQTHSVLPNLRDEHITGKLNGGYNLFDQADRDDYRLPG